MISFSLTEDQQMVQETVRKYAADVLRGKAREWEKAGGPATDARRAFHELGVSLVDVPDALGGTGLGVLTAAIVHEELAHGDPGAAVALWSPHLVPAALLELATPEQAKRLLARWNAPTGATQLGAVAWSEAGKGLPETGFATTAKKDGDGWILDGEKAYVVNGGIADLYVVFAQVDGAAGWKGIGAFAVEGKNPGVKAGARAAWVGLETVHASTVRFEKCRVGDGDRLLGGGDVAAAARRFFARAQLATAARQVGLARASYEYALEYTQERTAFGKKIGHFQAISFALAEMAMEVDAARWMVWRAAASLDEGAKSALEDAGKAAVHANEAAWRVADQGVQLLGGAGFIQDYLAEKWMRDTKALALVGGADQQSQLDVAAAELGKPDEFGAGLPVSWIQPVVT